MLENTPWSSPIFIFLAFGLYSVVHSLLAALKTKDLAAALFGENATDRYYRLFFNIFGVISLLPVFAMVALLPDQALYNIGTPWNLLMLAIQGLGGLFAVAAVLHTGPFAFLGLSQPIVGKENREAKLNTGGIYAWVRHPIYTGGMVFLWFSPVMTFNIFAFNLGITLYFIIGAWFEERKLLHFFGQEYEDYMQKTPMIIPWVGWK
ncbi:MAG: isoprenylcysteine carboxylmethyltransferase family protein [Chloroflexi bacterium]|nr:MAG: isoprenylcysteine carboxylmethyltransferase family protein [Chloroflexota bacterium]MBL1197076.1 isoprenylcysteine carboxylmethyltransferase family protein [Chloroflexota bacterium]NOH14371.1 isoprenylcysteine carboxylmethyltransferase family protein [Chloroflexota bacterium]